MRARHVVFQVVDIVLDVDNPGNTFKAKPLDEPPLDVGGNLTVTRLPKGMQSGRSSVMIDITLDDGTRLLAEMSMSNFLTTAAALTGAEQRDGWL